MAYTTVPKSTAYFEPKIYTGNGSAQTFSGFNFAPEMAWFKRRNAVVNHLLTDITLGTNWLIPDTTDAVSTTSDAITSYTSDGYAIGANARLNTNTGTYASWNWKGGTTSGIATNGSTQITPSSYSFNQTSGFSIIRYTGIGGQPKTIPHGLGVQPKMFIIKRINGSGSWGVLPQQISTGHLYLDAQTALGTVNPLSGGVLADTVNFSVSNSGDVNASGGTYVAYCFADVQGFSKMGSYIGNGSADGTFIFTGMKPAFILLKNSATSSGWYMYDNKRPSVYNPNATVLFANATTAEITNTASDEHPIDFLSNGFKIRTTSSARNGSGNAIVYMAFAEEPLVSTNGTPATAR